MTSVFEGLYVAGWDFLSLPILARRRTGPGNQAKKNSRVQAVQANLPIPYTFHKPPETSIPSLSPSYPSVLPSSSLLITTISSPSCQRQLTLAEDLWLQARQAKSQAEFDAYEKVAVKMETERALFLSRSSKRTATKVQAESLGHGLGLWLTSANQAKTIAEFDHLEEAAVNWAAERMQF
ncbi:hypothetical protein BKA80DRAFT_255659 [Phyllosticta citrichinensis]